MANQDTAPRLRFLLFAGGGLVALGLMLSAVMFANGQRSAFSEADRAESAVAVARMDAAQARADQAREQAQKRVYKAL